VSDTGRHIDALTGLRGIAAWWVVLYHFHANFDSFLVPAASRFVANGYLAVDLFFVLSGFVLFLNYGRAFEALEPRAVYRFLAARLARIYPLHFVVSVLFLANPLAILLFSESGQISARYDPGYYFASLLLVHNWGFYDQIAWNIPSWSISTELFAYILFPALAVAIHRYAGAAGRAAVVIGLLVAAIAALFGALGVQSIGEGIPTLGLVRCVLEFSLGALCCRFYLSRPPPGAGEHRLALALFAGLAGLYIGTAAPDYLVMPAAFVALILGLTFPGGWTGRVLASRPLLFLGEISYSTYLVHYFVKDWVKFLLVENDARQSLLVLAVYLGAIFLASILLYRAVEKPGRSLFRNLLIQRRREPAE